MARRPLQVPLPWMRVDRSLGIPIERQIYGALRQAIRQGLLQRGFRLPSARQLALDLGVSRRAVTNAMTRLETEGYIAEARVSAAGVAMPRRDSSIAASSRAAMFAPQMQRGLLAPGTTDFPHKRWLQCLERAWSANDDERALRRAIAAHVCPMRGIVAAEDEIVIAANREEALACAAQLLADPGDLVLVENPGDPRTRALFRAHGLRIRADRLDAEGLNFAAAAEAPRLIHVTPSRQFPSGVQMTLGRQYLLLQWAKSIGATIIEEDRDGDARAIKTADNDGRVVYVGSFEKLLHPDVGTAFLIVPRELAPLAQRILAPPQWRPQSALASFIEQGELARHIQRMRGIYNDRRETLVAELHRRLSGVLQGITPGAALDVVLWLAPHLDDLAIAAECAEIAPLPLGACSVKPGELPPALILGYGAVTARDASVAVEQLARAIEKSEVSRLHA